MKDLWKWGTAALVGITLGALSTKLGKSGATATQPRTRKKRWDHKDYDLEYEICGGENPREVTASIQLKPTKGGWSGNHFRAKLVPRKTRRKKRS